MANVSVYNMEGKEVGTMELNDSIITGFKSDENRSICRPYSAGRETVFSFRSGQ